MAYILGSNKTDRFKRLRKDKLHFPSCKQWECPPGQIPASRTPSDDWGGRDQCNVGTHSYMETAASNQASDCPVTYFHWSRDGLGLRGGQGLWSEDQDYNCYKYTQIVGGTDATKIVRCGPILNVVHCCPRFCCWSKTRRCRSQRKNIPPEPSLVVWFIWLAANSTMFNTAWWR